MLHLAGVMCLSTLPWLPLPSHTPTPTLCSPCSTCREQRAVEKYFTPTSADKWVQRACLNTITVTVTGSHPTL